MKLSMKNARLQYAFCVSNGETRDFESWLLHELETCSDQRDTARERLDFIKACGFEICVDDRGRRFVRQTNMGRNIAHYATDYEAGTK